MSAVHSEILDTPATSPIPETQPEDFFERIARLAARFFDAPMGVLRFAAQDPRLLTARYGTEYAESGGEITFHRHTILESEALVVSDAAADARFRDLAMVAGPPGIRFYAGVPILGSNGAAMGSLAIMDPRPRGPLARSEISVLRDFGALAAAELFRPPGTAASEDHARLAAIVQSSQNAIIGMDLEGVIQSWNPAAERIYGYSAAEVLGKTARALLPSGSYEEVANAIDRVKRGQNLQSFEAARVRKDGSRLYVSVVFSPIKSAGGHLTGISGIATDITKLKEAEEARRVSEQRYATLFHARSQAVVYLDAQGVVRSVNPAAERILCRPASELLGQTVPDDHPAMRALRAGTGFRDIVVNLENVRTGNSQWLSIDSFPQFRPSETRAYEVLSIAHEITAQVESEARLRASEERFRLLIEQGLEVIGAVDARGAIHYVSPSVARVMGYESESLIGKLIFDYVHPDDLSKAQQAFGEVCASPGSSKSIRLRFARRDGEWRYGELTSTNRLDVRGLEAIVLNLRDITPQERFEQQLKDSRHQLRQLARRIESAREDERVRIAREIHDELGQMLSALKLDLEGLPSRHHSRNAVSRNALAARLASLTQNIEVAINTVRRIAAELRPSMLNDLGLAAAMKWQIQEFESRTGIPCRCHGLHANFHLGAEPALAIFRIFQEILTNILRHADAREVGIQASVKDGRFRLRVADNGKGLDLACLEQPSSLGILGMRERAQAIGGSVDFSLRRGGGTVVTVNMRVRKNGLKQHLQTRESAKA